MPRALTGRPTGVRLTNRQVEGTRAKIKAAFIIARLVNGFTGKVLLTPEQVRIGFGLLAKVVPDLQRIEHTGEDGKPIEYRDATQLTEAEIQARIVELSGGRGADAAAGAALAAPGSSKPN